MKLNKKHSNLLFALFMSVIMALLMSGVLTIIYTGFSHNVISRWLHSFIIAWPIAFPSILIIAPVVRKTVMHLTESPSI